jgi:hypothetical protein
MTGMRTLLGPSTSGDLRELYAAPRTPWLRVNMVSTVDGAATGESGLTDSINNQADQLVFGLLRDLLDQGVADELACTFVPRLVAGIHPRITDGPPVDVPLSLHSLVEADGTLLGRWFRAGRPGDAGQASSAHPSARDPTAQLDGPDDEPHPVS